MPDAPDASLHAGGVCLQHDASELVEVTPAVPKIRGAVVPETVRGLELGVQLWPSITPFQSAWLADLYLPFEF